MKKIFPTCWFPAMLSAGGIFVLSCIPGDIFPSMPWNPQQSTSWLAQNPDKIIHFLLFATLAATLVHGFFHGTRFRLLTIWILAMGITSFYGATDEWHQILTPHRSCDVMDWIADTVGAVVSGTFLTLIYRKFCSQALDSSNSKYRC